jgi:hypothetical protein
MEIKMSHLSRRRINLRKLADRLWASMSRDWTKLYANVPTDVADVVVLLRKERLEMTDWDFRQRYSRWL